jgi:hypothetical protein
VSTPDKGPLQALLDLVVYAPVGFAASSRELMPDLVAKGREQVVNQGRMARALGPLAVAFGKVEGRKRLSSVFGGDGRAPHDTASATRAPAAVTVEPEPPSTTPPAAPAPAAKRTRRPRGADEEVVAVRRLAAVTDPEPDATVPAAHELAIPGYDSLAASQVVARLEGLTTLELEQVRRYEQANRNRRTILGKVAQLEGTRT